MPSPVQQDLDSPFFERSGRSRSLCQYGLACCWLVSAACLAVGIYLVAVEDVWLTMGTTTREVVPLALNAIVTVYNETCGHIHNISLRWSLQRESRLNFNSNLRLFTSAPTSRPNAWYSNLLLLLCMVASYASTSVIFIGSPAGDSAVEQGAGTFVCGYALLALSIGLIGQAFIATCCLRAPPVIPTWSPDPIDTAAACISRGAVRHQGGRCMQSVHDIQSLTEPVTPRLRQRNAFRARSDVRTVVHLLWGTSLLVALWGSVLIAVIHSRDISHSNKGSDFSFFPGGTDAASLINTDDGEPSSGTHTVSITWNILYNSSNKRQLPLASFVWAFALLCLLQTLLTSTLHCAELHVNIIRDEMGWRRAAKGGLQRSQTNALVAAITPVPALVLIVFKPLIHWLYGLGISIYLEVGVVMRPPQIFYLAVGTVLLAVTSSTCALWRPKGPQPATFGHLQTLVDLIDEWPEEKQHMFWGHKGSLRHEEGADPSEGLPVRVEAKGMEEVAVVASDEGHTIGRIWQVAHAGTSPTMLEEVSLDGLYM